MLHAVLDEQACVDRTSLHACLAKSLHFPAWYGGNLDALFDCLTDLREEATITILNRVVLEGALGDYAALFLRVCQRAALENPNLYLQVENPN